MMWQRCGQGLLMFMHKNALVRVRSRFGYYIEVRGTLITMVTVITMWLWLGKVKGQKEANTAMVKRKQPWLLCRKWETNSGLSCWSPMFCCPIQAPRPPPLLQTDYSHNSYSSYSRGLCHLNVNFVKFAFETSDYVVFFGRTVCHGDTVLLKQERVFSHSWHPLWSTLLWPGGN